MAIVFVYYRFNDLSFIQKTLSTYFMSGNGQTTRGKIIMKENRVAALMELTFQPFLRYDIMIRYFEL